MLQPSSTIYRLQMEWGVQILQCSFAGVCGRVPDGGAPPTKSHKCARLCISIETSPHKSSWNNIGTPWNSKPSYNPAVIALKRVSWKVGQHSAWNPWNPWQKGGGFYPSSCASPLVCVEKTWSCQKLLQAKFSQHCWKLSEYPEQRNTKSKVLIKIAGFLAGA